MSMSNEQVAFLAAAAYLAGSLESNGGGYVRDSDNAKSIADLAKAIYPHIERLERDNRIEASVKVASLKKHTEK